MAEVKTKPIRLTHKEMCDRIDNGEVVILEGQMHTSKHTIPIDDTTPKIEKAAQADNLQSELAELKERFKSMGKANEDLINERDQAVFSRATAEKELNELKDKIEAAKKAAAAK